MISAVSYGDELELKEKDEAASPVVPNTGLSRGSGAWQSLKDE